jgi:hypothetical protein
MVAQSLYEEEQKLLQSVFNVPIYFALETPELTELYEQIRRISDKSSSLIDAFLHPRFHMEAQTPEPAKLPSLSATNIQVWRDRERVNPLSPFRSSWPASRCLHRKQVICRVLPLLRTTTPLALPRYEHGCVSAAVMPHRTLLTVSTRTAPVLPLCLSSLASFPLSIPRSTPGLREWTDIASAPVMPAGTTFSLC